jgi:hypothetical protein
MPKFREYGRHLHLELLRHENAALSSHIFGNLPPLSGLASLQVTLNGRYVELSGQMAELSLRQAFGIFAIGAIS